MVNASPLIVLGKLGHLDLLSSLCAEVVVPAAVVREVCAGPIDDPARRALEAEELGRQESVPAVDAVVAAWDLGAGEADVLTWARDHVGCEAILDDLAARNCARALRIPVRGTLGVLLLAHREGLVGPMEPLIDRATAAGLRIDEKTAADVLRLAGEEG